MVRLVPGAARFERRGHGAPYLAMYLAVRFLCAVRPPGWPTKRVSTFRSGPRSTFASTVGGHVDIGLWMATSPGDQMGRECPPLLKMPAAEGGDGVRREVGRERNHL